MSNADVVRKYFYCLDHEDWEQMRELWADDGALFAVGARPRHGIDEVMSLFAKLFVPWPEHRDDPTRLIVDGDTVVAEVTFTGTTEDGRDVRFDAVDVFDLRDGRIVKETNWYDTALARKLLAPAATA
jgi:ketosteroid isomerase-like protein